MIDFQTIDRLVQEAQQGQLCKESWILDAYDRVHQFTRDRVSYYKFLRSCVRFGASGTVLEIGVEFGIASAMMAAEGKGTVIGIDLNHHDIPASIAYHCPNYHYVLGDSTSEIVVRGVKNHVALHGKLELVFQDSSHHYEASLREWEAYSPLLAPGALWICDDVTPAFHDPNIDPPGKGMVEYFHSLPGQKKLYPNVLHNGNTMGVVIL